MNFFATLASALISLGITLTAVADTTASAELPIFTCNAFLSSFGSPDSAYYRAHLDFRIIPGNVLKDGEPAPSGVFNESIGVRFAAFKFKSAGEKQHFEREEFREFREKFLLFITVRTGYSKDLAGAVDGLDWSVERALPKAGGGGVREISSFFSRADGGNPRLTKVIISQSFELPGGQRLGFHLDCAK